MHLDQKYLVWNNSLVPSGALAVKIGGSILVKPFSLKIHMLL